MNNFKRVLAVLLAGTMISGSAVVAFAEDPTATGAGTYEGDKMAYPTLAVTLPTAPDDYNYIADPNGNIAATNGARAEGYTFTGNTGVYFLTDATNKKYSEVSGNYTVENKNAQDIIVTAEMKVTTAAAGKIKVSKTADFSGDDVKASNAIYLAIQNGAKTQVKPLEAGTANATASLEMVVKGKKENYKATYDANATPKYSYALTAAADTLTWNKCAFNITGALNKNVAWELTNSDVFPSITVTYKFAAVPIMSGDAATGYTGTIASKPAGTIQGLTIDGTDRSGVVSNGKITYNATSGEVKLDPAPVANFGLATGNHTIVVKIGSTADAAVAYTLNIEN